VASVEAEGALTGLKVLDLSRVLAGPYCTMLLGDHGAEIIKVEQPDGGDGTREWGPPWVEGESAYFFSANRNKASITVDLKTYEGRRIIHRLAARADVVVENFKPGTTARLGIDYETLSAANPGLVYCSITGYGQTGPYRDRPGYDFALQAESGLMSITGPPDGEPYKLGVAIVDLLAGLFATQAILAACYERQRSGKGQYIDVALFDSAAAALINVAQNHLATGEPALRYGNAHPNIVPYETVSTADGTMALAVGNDAQFTRMCDLLGVAGMAQDPLYANNAARVSNRAGLMETLRAQFRLRTTEQWTDLLLAAGIPAAPVNSVADALSDPQLLSRAMVQSVPHPTAGTIRLLGPVAKLSRTPAVIRSAPPLLGADTNRILAESGM
jgi:crotonobetainyl-CoA:carnitine CoA-transferase CaiB-like acyl-CoA transferase